MARPHKDESTRRNIMFRLRLTAAEKTALQHAADDAGLSLSDFVRNRAVSSQPVHRKANPERAALIRGLAALGKIGSNLNQIARVANRLQNDAAPLPGKLVADASAQIHVLSQHLIKILSHGD